MRAANEKQNIGFASEASAAEDRPGALGASEYPTLRPTGSIGRLGGWISTRRIQGLGNWVHPRAPRGDQVGILGAFEKAPTLPPPQTPSYSSVNDEDTNIPGALPAKLKS